MPFGLVFELKRCIRFLFFLPWSLKFTTAPLPAPQKNGFPLVAQLVKNLPAVCETWVWFLGWEDPRRRGRLPTPVFCPGEFHGLYSPWGHKESDTTEWLSLSHLPPRPPQKKTFLTEACNMYQLWTLLPAWSAGKWTSPPTQVSKAFTPGHPSSLPQNVEMARPSPAKVLLVVPGLSPRAHKPPVLPVVVAATHSFKVLRPVHLGDPLSLC